MIKRTPGFTTTSGKTFPLVRDAQIDELERIVEVTSLNPQVRRGIAEAIVDNKDEVVDILTTTENSRPTARKANGAKRAKRKPVEQTPPATESK